MPAGRPSKYSEAYCNEVIDCGSRGLSLTAFAGEIGVDRATIDNWRKEYPEFFLACNKAQAKRTAFLEGGMLRDDATGPMVTARRFALVNADPDHWREKQEHTHGVTDALAELLKEIDGKSRGLPIR
jgi:hypothetical protein